MHDDAVRIEHEIDPVPGSSDDPTGPTEPPPCPPISGLRLLYVSVRGHCYLAGNSNIHPVDSVPAGVGTRFASLDQIESYVRHELRGLSTFWQVRVIDDDGTVVRYGFRAGPGGTGETWVWRPASTEPATTPDDPGQ